MRFLLLLLLLASAPASAATTVAIGQTDFPLGEAGFPICSACIDPSGCPGDVPLVDSNLDPVPRRVALLGHDLSLVVIDMDEADVFHMLFPRPIVNEPGYDLYLAQAEFTGDPDLEDGIHNMQIRFFGSTTWHTVAAFTEDPSTVGIVTISDPEARQVGYFLWYAKEDLTDFGFAPGASITGLEIRGPVGGGLDTAVAGNLNLPEPGTDTLLPAGILGLALARAWRQRRVWRPPS